MSYKASQTRQIHFRSKGGSYSAIWMGSRGDIYQEYLTANGSTTYYPSISTANPITMNLTVTSARTQGTVTPVAVTYYANGTELTFNTSGACTNTGWGSVFKKDASGNLVIIGNLGAVLMSSFLLEATVSVTATYGTDSIRVWAPVTLVPYSGNDTARVTIAPGDNKNFTIGEKGDSCILKAITYKGGQEVTAGLAYEWYRFTSGAFAKITGATSQTLTVQEADVDTYSLYKVIVKESNTEIGYDIQSVLDASDPYDVIMSSVLNNGSGGNSTSTNDLTLDDEMPDAAYIEFTCQFVKRGQTATVVGTQSFLFTVVAGNGLQLWHPATLSGNKCRITVADLKTHGIGDYEIIAEGTLS